MNSRIGCLLVRTPDVTCRETRVYETVHRLQRAARELIWMSRASQLAKPYKVTSGRSFRLRDIDPADTGDVRSKEDAEMWLGRGVTQLSELQEKLYAQDRWALLLIFQAMDAAGRTAPSSTSCPA
jgi:polyphosphate kinase 2 (PPK2 family)